MGAVRTMGRRRLERERRVGRLQRWLQELEKQDKEYARALGRFAQEVMDLRAMVADPEGTIQRGINERYSNDLRQREMEHHASWDAEVVVHKMASARWMRSCVLDVVKDEAVRAAIEALPLVPE